MTAKNKVIAILCADIHLQHRPPIWRSAEPDWYTAMKRPLNELRELQEKYQCPVLCAGDIFDRWNSPAELINFALANLPDQMWSVAGQHDMPEHHPEEIHRSAYATLVEADKIQSIWRGTHISPAGIQLRGFSFGFLIKSIEPKSSVRSTITGKKDLKVALIHQYCCTYRASYPRAPQESYVSWKKGNIKLINNRLFGYDVIIYGDNHISFQAKIGKTIIWNCGTLMRRHSDEIDYKPRVGLLFEDGHVDSYHLDTSQDKYLEPTCNENPEELDMETLYEELKRLQTKDYNYPEEVIRHCKAKKVSKEVTEVLIKAMENE